MLHADGATTCKWISRPDSQNHVCNAQCNNPIKADESLDQRAFLCKPIKCVNKSITRGLLEDI